LAESQTLFPKADLLCSDAAKPRLSKVTGLDYNSLNKLCEALPRHIRILEPLGLKTGEVWMELETKKERIWFVADAFTSEAAADTSTYATPALLKTFPKYGVDDRKLYVSWAEQQIADRAPTILIPCHGPPVRLPNLAVSLRGLVASIQ
jgi:hypothetical protein